MATMTTLEKVGSRLYLVGLPFSAKDRAKSALGMSGKNWDADRRQWWVGLAKKADAEALLAELNGTAPPVMVATAGSAQVAASVGLDADTPAGIVADKLQEAGKDREAANVRAGQSAQQDPDDIRLTGKGRYKGKEYYAGAMTKDRTRVRLLTLPDANGKYLDFWAPCAEVEQTKVYEPREKWNGRRGSSSAQILVYTTLGSIADFIAKQKRLESTGAPQCPVCGKRNDNMVLDHETGMTCCRSCCDMPAD